MPTLSARATPQQLRILRAVHGAVRDAAQAHPGWITDPRAAGSIAKRATGTLTQPGGALAGVSNPSEQGAVALHSAAPKRSSQLGMASADVAALEASKGRGGTAKRRAPDALKTLWVSLGMLAREARVRGDMDYHEGICDALRLVGALRMEV